MQLYLNMFEEPKFRPHHKKGGYSTGVVIGIIALIIVILIILVMNNRDTAMDNTVIPGQTNTAPTTDTNTERDTTTIPTPATPSPVSAAAQLKARNELGTIRTKLAADKNYDAALASVEALEADLESDYSATTGVTKEFWTQVKAEFDTLEVGLKADSTDSLTLIDKLITNLQAEVRVSN